MYQSNEQLEQLLREYGIDLQQEHKRLRAVQSVILDSVRDPLWTTDPAFKIVYWNDAAAATFGWTADEVQGQFTVEMFKIQFPGSSHEEAISHLLQKGEFRGEVLLHCKDGGPILTEMSSRLVRGPDGEVVRVVSTVRDISERKKAEQALRISEERFRALATASSDVVYRMSPDWSESWQLKDRVFVKETDGPSETLLETYVHPDDLPLMLKAISKAIRNKSIIELEHRLRQTDGTFTWTYDKAVPMLDANGEIHEWVGTLTDITARKKAETALHTSNEDLEKSIEMKDEFLCLVSHEFKTPLTVINSAVQAMRMICKDELSEKGNGFLSKILQNSNRQLKLVNNLLDITRANAGRIKINRKNIDIISTTRTITESIRIFAEHKGIRLLLSSTMAEKTIGIDEEKYERILLNLLSNAIKFTPKGKSIVVRASQKIIKGKRKVCIQVKDQGIGIPQNMCQLIFERFGQVDSSLSRQAEGTGIGLSLVKMFVELMDGEISVESEVGSGSTFTVLFPAARINETPIEKMLQEINDHRLIQATAIEFSDIT